METMTPTVAKVTPELREVQPQDRLLTYIAACNARFIFRARGRAKTAEPVSNTIETPRIVVFGAQRLGRASSGTIDYQLPVGPPVFPKAPWAPFLVGESAGWIGKR
jgi:hypothetical protein